MTLESDAKFEEKLTRGLENNMRNLENLTRALESGAQNWEFYGLHLSQVENV